MYTRILVPTDGSATANLGLKEAIAFAKCLGSRIRLIHVVDNSVLNTTYPSGAALDRMLGELRALGTDLLRTAEEAVRAAGVEVDTKLVEGNQGATGEPIVQEAAAWSASLIVCGTHGRRGLRRIVMGSDAEYILRSSPVPVLLVRAQG